MSRIVWWEELRNCCWILESVRNTTQSAADELQQENTCGRNVVNPLNTELNPICQ